MHLKKDHEQGSFWSEEVRAAVAQRCSWRHCGTPATSRWPPTRRGCTATRPTMRRTNKPRSDIPTPHKRPAWRQQPPAGPRTTTNFPSPSTPSPIFPNYGTGVAGACAPRTTQRTRSRLSTRSVCGRMRAPRSVLTYRWLRKAVLRVAKAARGQPLTLGELYRGPAPPRASSGARSRVPGL